MIQPVAEEGGPDMLAGVDAEALDAGGIDEPASPVAQFALGDGGVDIAGEQVVGVAVLVADLGRELLPLEAEQPAIASLGVVLVVADRVEVPPMPLVAGVAVGARREVEPGPGGD